jgi:hypothetical protein
MPALRITVKTFTGLEGIISEVIKYRKPDGSVGDTAKGVIFHECIEGEIDMAV